jgi:Carboxypeptidase regulatory-like domain
MTVRWLALRILAALIFAARSEAQGGRLLTGVVVAKATQAPLGHSMVSLVPAGRQTFTDDAGRFAFQGLAPGAYQLRATHHAPSFDAPAHAQ